MSKFWGGLGRKKSHGRTIDLDSNADWPEFVSVVAEDEFGPLVVSIAQAVVYPDSSVSSNDVWLVSERFGLLSHTVEPTETIPVDGERAFVLSTRESQREFASTIGPRIATLSRVCPDVPVMISGTRQDFFPLFDACKATFGGVSIRGGAAHAVNSAYFVRIPSPSIHDGQVAKFADLFRNPNAEPTGSVYLEYNDGKGRPFGDASLVDARFEAEKSGARLLPTNRTSVETIVRAVVGARNVTIESPELMVYAGLATPPTEVTVVSSSVRRPRDPSRVTTTGTFDIDNALRTGQALPHGVDVISRPDYDVPDTSVDRHRVFEGTAWRAQSPTVLNEQSLGPWIVSVKNAIVAPNGSVLLEDGTLLSGTYFGSPRGQLDIDGWITSETDGRAGLALTMSKAFGHGLLQVAPRVDALTRFDSSMELLLSNYLWNDSALIDRLGVDTTRIRRVSRFDLEHLIRVPELIVSTHLYPERPTARADPRWRDEFSERFTGGGNASASRRVHLARRDSSGRRGGCVNREVIHELAAELGYETIYPEDLSLADQIALATSSVDMFGEQGSALTWAMFMPPESRLIVVQNRADDLQRRYQTYYNPVLAAGRSSYYDIGAVRAGITAFYEIDPTRVRRALETI